MVASRPRVATPAQGTTSPPLAAAAAKPAAAGLKEADAVAWADWAAPTCMALPETLAGRPAASEEPVVAAKEEAVVAAVSEEPVVAAGLVAAVVGAGLVVPARRALAGRVSPPVDHPRVSRTDTSSPWMERQ
jgi:hypothetical protein